MKKFLKAVGTVLIISFTVVLLSAKLSLWSLRKSTFYKPAFVTNGLNSNNYDYIVLGASTGLTTLNTIQIDSIINTKGVNLAMDDTAMSTQYLMLQHFLAEGNTTKYCVLAPSNATYNTSSRKLNNNDYRFLSHIDRSYVYNYYSQFNGFEARVLSVSKWLPFIGLAYYNAELFYPSVYSIIKPTKKNRFDNYGNYTYPSVYKEASPIIKEDTLSISFSNPYLLRINELCQKHDIELICYISPMEFKTVIYDNTSFSIVNHSNILKTKDLFYDEIHVTTEGRTICSLALAKALETSIKD